MHINKKETLIFLFCQSDELICDSLFCTKLIISPSLKRNILNK